MTSCITLQIDEKVIICIYTESESLLTVLCNCYPTDVHYADCINVLFYSESAVSLNLNLLMAAYLCTMNALYTGQYHVQYDHINSNIINC